MRKWQKIVAVITFGVIGLFVFFRALFECSHQTHDTPRRIAALIFDGGLAEMVIVEQGAWGSYAELRIYNSDAEHIESISMRVEDATLSVDSIIGKDIYVSYHGFPGCDSILSYDRVMLGESLLEHDKLKFNYHFTNIK